MKKSILTLTLILISVFSVQAQQVIQQDIDVTATVITKLSIASTQDVEVGTIITNEQSVLPANSNDNSSVTNAGVNSNSGQIVLDGAIGQDVTVQFTGATLANSKGGIAIFAPRVFNDATPIISSDQVTLTGGQLILDIGGTLSAIADGDEGDYSTTNSGGSPISFTFTYVNI